MYSGCKLLLWLSHFLWKPLSYVCSLVMCAINVYSNVVMSIVDQSVAFSKAIPIINIRFILFNRTTVQYIALSYKWILVLFRFIFIFSLPCLLCAYTCCYQHYILHWNSWSSCPCLYVCMWRLHKTGKMHINSFLISKICPIYAFKISLLQIFF